MVVVADAAVRDQPDGVGAQRAGLDAVVAGERVDGQLVARGLGPLDGHEGRSETNGLPGCPSTLTLSSPPVPLRIRRSFSISGAPPPRTAELVAADDGFVGGRVPEYAQGGEPRVEGRTTAALAAGALDNAAIAATSAAANAVPDARLSVIASP